MRTNLHIHFHCSGCGALLKCPMHSEVDTTNHQSASHLNSVPTPESGAYCNQTSIYVEPCQRCINKVTAPAKKLADAIKELQ